MIAAVVHRLAPCSHLGERAVEHRRPGRRGDQSTPANLSGRRWPAEHPGQLALLVGEHVDAEVPLASIACQDPTPVGQNSTSGGSSDSAANDWQANPTGAPSCTVVMTVMPVQNCPST